MVGVNLKSWFWARMAMAVLAGALPGSEALADYKTDYIKGRQAMNSGDYAQAISFFNSAIADQPRPADKIRFYGMRYDPYLPHFFLGKSYLAAGDCKGALKSFEQAESYGIVSSRDEYSDLQSGMKSCASQIVDLTPYLASANAAIERLDEANKRFSKLQSEPLLSNEWQTRWAPELAELNGLSRNFRDQLATAQANSDQVAIEAVTSSAGNAINRINGSRDLALARINSLRESALRLAAEQRAAAARELSQAIAAARALELPDRSNAVMNSLFEDLTAQVSKTENLSRSDNAINLQEAARGITNTIRKYQLSEQDWRVQQQAIADRTPPPLLKDIASAYFTGDYRTTISLVKPEHFASGRARIQALLFRAAASYKLYVLSEQREIELLRQAESDIRAIKLLNNNFSPYISAFSPNFLEFFRRTS